MGVERRGVGGGRTVEDSEGRASRIEETEEEGVEEGEMVDFGVGDLDAEGSEGKERGSWGVGRG